MLTNVTAFQAQPRVPALAPVTPLGHPWEDDDTRGIDLLKAYRALGDICTGDELAGRLRTSARDITPLASQPISLVARWIVQRQIISFSAAGETWVPLFQFDDEMRGPREGLREILAQLSETFDSKGLGEWFAQPNAWLDEATPAMVLMSGGAAQVMQAARADRFVATGW